MVAKRWLGTIACTTINSEHPRSKVRDTTLVNPAAWHQVKLILEQALEQPPAERVPFVRHACQDNADVRLEVESLLAEAGDDAGGFLESPAELPPTSQAPEFGWIGRQLGRHRIESRLGTGGMGHVFLASSDDGRTPSKVAIKVIREDVGAAALQRRFEQEHTLHARLVHPGVARLVGRGTFESRPYLVLEHVEGLPIDVYCRQRRLNLEQRIALFIEVCTAVQYVHDQGIVHRDIKPANLLVTQAGRPKLLDFGIAEQLRGGVMVTADREGFAMFTPECAAPEQLRCEPLTASTDVYGLGLLLYRLLTGHTPHEAYRSGLTLVRLRSICHDEPRRASDLVDRAGAEHAQADHDEGLPEPSRLSGLLRGRLDRILLRALANRQTDRYASAAALAADLREHLQAVQQGRRDLNPIRLLGLPWSVSPHSHRVRTFFLSRIGVSRERRGGRSRLPSDRT